MYPSHTGATTQRDKPIDLEKIVADLPTGYAGQNKSGIVLKPSGMTLSAPQGYTTPVWNEIADYDSQNFANEPVTAPVSPLSAPAVQGQSYNEGVKIFPIGADDTAPTYTSTPPYSAPGEYGRLEQKIFFAHGSATVHPTDKTKLRLLVKREKKKTRPLSVMVVGHASNRVNRVKDPLQKKMINLAMAQKRANAVTHELHKAGLNPAWVQAVSKGDEEPNTDAPGLPQEAADRRVEIYVNEK
jgi:outer membrane protein OmpA-like peptidoglycan-associated protein